MEVLLKYRSSILSEFRNFCRIPKSYINRYIGPLSSSVMQIHLISSINEPAIAGFRELPNVLYTLNADDTLILIEGVGILIYTNNSSVRFFKLAVISHIKYGECDWNFVTELMFHEKVCLCDSELSFFLEVGGGNSLFSYTDESEIKISNLEEISISNTISTLKQLKIKSIVRTNGLCG